MDPIMLIANIRSLAMFGADRGPRVVECDAVVFSPSRLLKDDVRWLVQAFKRDDPQQSVFSDAFHETSEDFKFDTRSGGCMNAKIIFESGRELLLTRANPAVSPSLVSCRDFDDVVQQLAAG